MSLAVQYLSSLQDVNNNGVYSAFEKDFNGYCLTKMNSWGSFACACVCSMCCKVCIKTDFLSFISTRLSVSVQF